MINPFLLIAKKAIVLFPVFLSFFLFSSCGDSSDGDTNAIKVSVSKLIFDAVGGTQTISVTAENVWNAEVSSEGREWLTVLSSNNAVCVMVKENLQTSARQSYIELKSGNKSVKILVSQKACVSVESISFSQEELILEEGESKQITVTILPENATNKKVSWTISDTTIARIDSAGRIQAITIGKTSLRATSKDGSNVSAICNVSVLEAHEYVDLGLPSHTLWANRNMGAKEPWNTGDYFAWGQMRSYEGGQLFNRENYKYYDSELEYTKYTRCTTLAPPDNLTVLEPADDAATYYWGPLWTMPTVKQFQELIDHCIWSRVNDTKANKYGWMVQSKTNNNNIFFPFAGYYSCYMGKNTMPNSSPLTSNGYYWTKELSDIKDNYSKDNFAAILELDIRSYAVSAMLRYYGLPIRPVRKK